MRLKIKTIEDLQKFLLKILIPLIITFIVFLLSSAQVYAQVCESGTLVVSGPGCGCLSGCDLTALGGPNCGSGTSGNCDGGYLTMSTTFEVPAGCDVKITAEMKPRSGCSSAGADGNCTSCDRLRIRDGAGPTPPWQIGGSNSSLFDQMTVTGPATIYIEGAANRADEIITYTIEDVGGCNCSQILPVTLTSFLGESYDENTNILEWTTSSEINNDYFTLERSIDAVNFEAMAIVSGNGNSNQVNNYHIYDHLPQNDNVKIYYYRLKQTDFDGQFTYYHIVPISRTIDDMFSFFVTEQQIIFQHLDEPIDFKIYDMTGRLIDSQRNFSDKNYTISNLKKGIYIFQTTSLSKKIVIN